MNLRIVVQFARQAVFIQGFLLFYLIPGKVLEETGYDLTSQIRQSDCVEMTIKEQRITLYIVGNVPEDYVFRTRTRKEISVCCHLC